jgi:Flp pilus assembly protein TadG
MSFLRTVLKSVLKDERGQSMMFVACGMTALIGVAGFTMDIGKGYIARQQLQSCTNDAALSGAVYLSNAYFNTTAASTAATSYSCTSGNLNESTILTNVQLQTPVFKCLDTVTKSMGIPCLGNPAYNAMIVTQTADVQTWFAWIPPFNRPIFHLTATAYATPGGAPAPLNMVIIVDTTGSMTTQDSYCANATELECAKNGVGIMLNSLPYPQDAPVALFAFPNIQANTVSSATTTPCSGSTTQVAYTTPALGANSYAPGTGASGTYRIVDFSTDYTNIKKAVGIVDSSGNTTTTGCLKTPGNGTNTHTFLAGAIAAAQAALMAQQGVHPVAPGQNVIVILTDGDVNASDQYMNVKPAMTIMAGAPYNTNTASTTTPADFPISPATSVTYPSGVGGCGQAVQVAQAARASTLQTSIFVVAYGSPTSRGWNLDNLTVSSGNVEDIMSGVTGNGVTKPSHCPTDQDAFFTTFKTATTGVHGTLPTSNNVSYIHTPTNITPCQTAQGIATPDTDKVIYFYADNMNASTGTCASNSGLTSLKQIFAAIVGELPHIPRVVPIGTT